MALQFTVPHALRARKDKSGALCQIKYTECETKKHSSESSSGFLQVIFLVMHFTLIQLVCEVWSNRPCVGAAGTTDWPKVKLFTEECWLLFHIGTGLWGCKHVRLHELKGGIAAACIFSSWSVDGVLLSSVKTQAHLSLWHGGMTTVMHWGKSAILAVGL